MKCMYFVQYFQICQACKILSRLILGLIREEMRSIQMFFLFPKISKFLFHSKKSHKIQEPLDAKL